MWRLCCPYFFLISSSLCASGKLRDCGISWRNISDILFQAPEPGPEVINLFSCSAEHEIVSANKYENANYSRDIFMLNYV